MGFVLPKKSYLRNSWNQIDFIIVIFALVGLFLSNNALDILKVFRVLRTLRPLRLISHNRGMKLVVNALVGSFGAIVGVVVVIGMIWIMWSIVGVNLIGGRLGYCDWT